MRADPVHAWAVAAAGAPVILVVHLGLTGTAPGAPAVLGTVTVFVLAARCLGRLLPRVAPRAGALLGRSLIAALAIVSGQAVLAGLDASARTDGCLPTVGRGARVGYGWLTLDPVVPCSDGLAAAPLTLAGAVAALAAVGAAVGLVLAQVGLALAAAGAGLCLAAASSLVDLPARSAALAATVVRLCPGSLLDLFGARLPAVRTVAPAHRRVTAGAPSPGTWFRVPARRGPPVPAIAQPC